MGTQIRRLLIFLFHPRRVVRDLVGTRPWRVVIACSVAGGSAFWIVGGWRSLCDFPPRGSLPMQPAPLFSALAFVGVSLEFFVFHFVNGALRARAGRQVGGHASAWELSGASACSTIPWFLWFALFGAAEAASAADPGIAQVHRGIAYFVSYSLLGLGLASLVWGYLLWRASSLEVQGFTRAQGRAAAWKATIIFARWFLVFTLAVIGISYGIPIIERHIR